MVSPCTPRICFDRASQICNTRGDQATSVCIDNSLMQIFGRTTPLICLRSFELRLSRSWTPPSQSFDDSVIEPQPMWVLCSVFPEMTEDGEVKEIVGCVTDIRCDYISTKKHSGTHAQFSQQKWSEKLQENQASNAQESKRQVDSNSCL